MKERTKAAVIGASGYAGEELLRLLLGHPHVDVTAVTSRQFADQTIAAAFPRFLHRARAKDLRFSAADPEKIAALAEIVFLALPHGVSAPIAAFLIKCGARVIDLSADFRLREASTYKEFYGQDHAAPDLLGE